MDSFAVEPDRTQSEVDGSGDTLSPVTVLLRRVQDGDSEAAEHLLPLVYERLRATAENLFRGENAAHTLQPTAVVHEAYLKLIGSSTEEWNSRAHFCAVASIAMRQILQDHARAKRSAKRGGARKKEPLTQVMSATVSSPLDALVLDETLAQLAEADERAARVFEMRFFGGLTHEEVAPLLGVSVPTAERAWRRARAWVASAVSEKGD